VRFLRSNWLLLLQLVALVMTGPLLIVVFDGHNFVRGFALGVGLVASLATVILVTILWTGTGPRIMGGAAEKSTVDELTPLLEHGYRLINHSGLGSGDIDHVLVGPGGVFVLETKWSGSEWELDRPRSWEGRAIHRLEKDAHFLALTLKAEGVSDATPVLVLWGKAARGLTGSSNPLRRLASGAVVVPGEHLARWALGRGRGVLSDQQVESIERRLSAHTLARDELETPGPLTVRQMMQQIRRVPALALAGLFGPVLLLIVLPTLPVLAVAIVAMCGGLWLRRYQGWRVAGTALVTTLAFWPLIALVDLAA
jgi:hypothetical protein